MNGSLNLKRSLVNFGIPLSFFGILILIMQSSALKENNSLQLAVTIDLVLIVPLVYMFLLRGTKLPKTTMIPVMIIGMLLGSYLLPKGSQQYLGIFKTWIFPIVELSIIGYVILKARSTIKKYKDVQKLKLDFFTTLKLTCQEILPKRLVIPFATEIATFYYGFIHWKTIALQEHEFTYHKKSGALSLFGGLMLLIVIETVTLHTLLAKWNTIVAWFIAAISAYTLVQVFGFARSLSKRPISLEDKNIHIKYGILNEAKIPYVAIDSIEISTKELEKSKEIKKLSPLGELEAHNIIMYLKKEHTLQGVYGIKKNFKVLLFHIDEPKEFK